MKTFSLRRWFTLALVTVAVPCAVVSVQERASAQTSKVGKPPPANPSPAPSVVKPSLGPSVAAQLEVKMKRPLSAKERALFLGAAKQRAAAIKAANDQFVGSLQALSNLPSDNVVSILDNTFVPSTLSILDDTIVPAAEASILDNTIVPNPQKAAK